MPEQEAGMKMFSTLILVLCLTVTATAQELEECQQHLNQLADATKTYAAQHGGKFPLDLTQLQPAILRELPHCPVAEKGYAINPIGREFTIYCQGKAHGVAGVPPNSPAFHSERGLVPFKLALKHARGKRVEIPGYRFKLPRGWLKVAGTKARGARLRSYSKERSVIGCTLLEQAPLVPLNPPSHQQWQSGTAFRLQANGYTVSGETVYQKGPLRGYLVEGWREDSILLVIGGATRLGYYEFSFEGDSQSRRSGLNALDGIVRSLERTRP